MKCRKINELLYLKPDELTAAELKAIKIHIAECEFCTNEFSAVSKTNEFIAGLSKVHPFLTNEVEFTDEVMQRIEQSDAFYSESFINDIIDKFSRFFLNAAVRATAVTLILILVSTFLFQQYKVFSSITTLENSLAVKNGSFSITQAGFSEVKVLKLASDFLEFFKGNQIYAEFTGGWILTNKTKLNEFLALYSDLQNYRSLYTKEIEKLYPDLNSFLGKKLSIEELQEFIKKNENLLKELGRKLPAGGK